MSVIKFFLLVLSLCLISGISSAQNKVVVVPIAGDDVIAVPIHGQVDADGALFFGSRILSSTKTQTGTYRLVFEDDVSRCIPAVTAFDLNRAYAAIKLNSTTWQIDVRQTSDRSIQDGGFFIIMSCPVTTPSASAKSVALEPQRSSDSE